MEMMLETDIPTYAGGLGVLAGDLLKSCADMGISAVGITLVYNGSIFSQHIENDGSQTFKEVEWRKMDQLTKLTDRITLRIHNEDVYVGVWRYEITGIDEDVVPVYLLDTNLPENSDWGREITQNLYADRGDLRISQEIVLGIGGVKMLRQLGYKDIKTYHMNEGHCAFVPLALLAENNFQDDQVRHMCTFTSHTPIPEGHDSFDYDFAQQYAGDYLPWHIKSLASQEKLHMTKLAMNMSKYSFGVSQKHGKISRHIFPDHDIGAITNGVHHRTWISPHLQDLYEKYLPGFMHDPNQLKKAVDALPDEELWENHMRCKRELMHYANEHLSAVNTDDKKFTAPEDYFDENTLTIALARRPVAYKRPMLLYHKLEKFLKIGSHKIQIIQCGKSHPHDQNSQNIVKDIVQISKKVRGKIRIDYLEDYSPRIARFLVAGADIWLNTPMQPLEASGTSGMKAAMNGVLNFSVPDGWWIEGYRMEPKAGFIIGEEIEGLEAEFNNDADAESIYTQLEKTIIPMYYDNRAEWIKCMKHAIVLGAYFNTHRCIREYKKFAWEKLD
jgi:glycogen phosphorylase